MQVSASTSVAERRGYGLGVQKPLGHDQSEIDEAIQPADSGVMRVITLGYSPLGSSAYL